MKTIFSFLAVLITISPISVVAQEHYFKILHFSIEEKEVKKYSITFELNGKEITPKREGNKIFVPNELRDSDGAKMKFQYSKYNFSFKVSNSLGYVDGDELKVDFTVKIDKRPFSDKHDLPSEYKGRFCVLYFLRKIPSVKPDSKLIADPITIIIGDVCPLYEFRKMAKG